MTLGHLVSSSQPGQQSETLCPEYQAKQTWWDLPFTRLLCVPCGSVVPLYPHSKRCYSLAAISVSVMQAGLASTAKWTRMSVFLTHARMEERVTTWWTATGVHARRVSKVKEGSTLVPAFCLYLVAYRSVPTSLFPFAFVAVVYSYSKHTEQLEFLRHWGHKSLNRYPSAFSLPERSTVGTIVLKMNSEDST